MKPEWKDAPEWAQYLAMDGDGAWWWYESRPHWLPYSRLWDSGDTSCASAGLALYAADTLEGRPK